MPQQKAKDVVYALTKGAVGAIPIVGAPASELLSVLIASPLERRREQWMNDVGERLRILEADGKVDFQKLQQNELFVDTVVQATYHAVKTSETEKITCFKNVIEKTALGESPEKTISQVYLNLLDRYTVWHIKILMLFDDPAEWFKFHGITRPNLMMGGLSHVLLAAFPELGSRRFLYDLIWAELERDGMHNSGSLHTMTSGNGMFENRTTDFGKGFLNFIRERK
jgi:hypothetical protein